MSAIERVLIHYLFPDRLGSELEERFSDVEFASCRHYGEVGDAIEAFRPDVCFSVREAGTPGFPRAALLNSPGLKWVANGGSGTDHLAPWNPDQVTVTNSAGVAADVMAQFVIGAVFAFNGGLPEFWSDKAQRIWRGDAKVSDITTKTLLIVGLGRIGQSVARLARAVGLRVVSIDVAPEPPVPVDQHASPDALRALAAEADYVTVCTPSTPQTRGMIDAVVFGAMKSEAVFINVGRGDLVDEAALVDALSTGAIRGAALDVFETEPLPQDSPIWNLDNVIVSPHCSSVFDGWELRAIRMFCDNIDRWRAGQPLNNVVQPPQG